jgi:hypothetical protein
LLVEHVFHRWRLRQIGHLLCRSGGTIALERPGKALGKGQMGNVGVSFWRMIPS